MTNRTIVAWLFVILIPLIPVFILYYFPKPKLLRANGIEVRHLCPWSNCSLCRLSPGWMVCLHEIRENWSIDQPLLPGTAR
jgi:hypothetical protein